MLMRSISEEKREKERGRERESESVCFYVCETERERKRESLLPLVHNSAQQKPRSIFQEGEIIQNRVCVSLS